MNDEKLENLRFWDYDAFLMSSRIDKLIWLGSAVD